MSEILGFSSQNYFCFAFKRETEQRLFHIKSLYFPQKDRIKVCFTKLGKAHFYSFILQAYKKFQEQPCKENYCQE